MNYEKYDVISSTDRDVFEFESSGGNGNIIKYVEFTQTENPLIYNLAFGDRYNLESEEASIFTVDDKIESKNGDRDKVLATVAMTVYEYTSIYPERYIFFTGSDAKRTRLYRMAISKNYEELNNDFHIFGISKSGDELLTVTFSGSVPFIGYLVKRKTQLKVKL